MTLNKKGKCGFLLLAMTSGSVLAEGYITPSVRGGVEYNTNRAMTVIPQDEEETTSYVAEIEATLGYRTPRSETEIVPMVRIREVTGADADPDGTDEYLDYRTRYRSERTQFDLLGRYRREDVFEGSLPPAGFDDFDPDDPTGGAGGRVTQDTRERIQLRPRYKFQVTPRVGLAFRAVAETVDFEEETLDEVGYDFWRFDGFATWQLSERWLMGVGPTVSDLKEDDGSGTEAYGVALDLRHEWSELSVLLIDAGVERSTIDDGPLSPVAEETVTRWRANVEIFHRTSQVSEWRVAAGRFLRPSTRGGKVTSDEVRLQYDRGFSDRLTSRVALRVLRDESISAQDNEDAETYGRLELGLRYALGEQWSVFAAYQYSYQEFQDDNTDAADHQGVIGIEFRGLGPPPVPR